MKKSSLLTFNLSPSDLTGYKECWIGETIEEREKRILDDIRAWRIKAMELTTEEEIRDVEKRSPYALLPSKNMRYIREVTFPVGDSVTLDHLRGVIPKIRENYVISGFQAAIDRERKTAHILFDWYDRSVGDCVYLYPNKRIRFSVFLVRELDLPRPNGYEMWLRHFLLEDYKEDHGVFRTLTDHLKHVRMSKKGYNVIRDAFQYVELVCQRLIK